MEDQFGYWLSGFIDGEGCFQVASSNTSYDDTTLIHAIRNTTDLGTIFSKPARGGSKPQITWTIQSQSDCLELVSILDRYPLRSRKHRDYLVWKEAVGVWTEFQGYKRLPPFKARIQEARAYPQANPL